MAPAMSKCPWRKVQGKRQENIDVIEIQSSVIDSYSNLRIEMLETKKWFFFMFGNIIYNFQPSGHQAPS